MEIRISNPQADVLLSTSAFTFFQTGQGGGKTFIMGILSYQLVLFCPKITGLIAANTYGQLSNSTLKEVTNAWKLLGLTEYNKINTDGDYVIDIDPPNHFKPHGFTFKNNFNKVFFKNGAVIFLASLDNYKVLDGMTLGWAMLDETKDTRRDAIEDVIVGRLRQKGLVKGNFDLKNGKLIKLTQSDEGEEVNPLFIFTSPAKEQWLTDFFNLDLYRNEIITKIYNFPEYFRYEDSLHCIIIASSFHNKENLSENYIENRIAQLGASKIDMHIYGNPFGKDGNEYYSDFNNSKHVGEYEYVDGYPIHLTFDFNVRPYMSASAWQLIDEGGKMELRCIREYTMPPPDDTIEAICKSFLTDFEYLLEYGLFYYGDASGKNRIPTEKARDLYKIVENQLSDYISESSRRLLRKNPTHRTLHYGTLGRRDFMNGMLRGLYNIDIRIDKSCRYLIADLEFVLQDQNGAKLKKKEVVDGVQGVERYGHLSDGMDYMVCYLFGEYMKE